PAGRDRTSRRRNRQARPRLYPAPALGNPDHASRPAGQRLGAAGHATPGAQPDQATRVSPSPLTLVYRGPGPLHPARPPSVAAHGATINVHVIEAIADFVAGHEEGNLPWSTLDRAALLVTDLVAAAAAGL